jgi:peptidoglycan/LPS O-acetylase OafA/YrhL
MDENPGVSEQYRMASPWPVFVALGIPISEIGLLFDVLPIAVGGLLLFCGSVAGMVAEAGYAKSPWRAAAGCAVALFAFAGLLVYLASTDGGATLGQRGLAVVVSGGLLLAGSLVGSLVVQDPSAV